LLIHEASILIVIISLITF